MKHGIALLIKFVMVAVVLEIVLNLMTDLTFGEILVISVAVTILAYIIGDLLILRASSNIVATISDIGLALVVIYLFNFVWYTGRISFIAALVAAAAIGLGEWFFHGYVAKNVFSECAQQ